MKDMKVVTLKPILKYKLYLWDRYEGTEGYESIKKFVCRQGVKKYIYDHEHPDMEMRSALFGGPAALYEQMQERHSYVLTSRGEPMAFLNFRLDDVAKGNPRMFIQGIATHPLHQREGLATEMMKIILKNPEKYMSQRPKMVYGLVDKENLASVGFFQKLGPTTVNYYGLGYNRVDTKLSFDESTTSQEPEENLEKGK